MDNRLSKAMQHANYAAAMQQGKADLFLKLQNDLVCAFNGGIFVSSEERISYLSHLSSNCRGVTQQILLDDRQRPILVENINLFLEMLEQARALALNRYYSGYVELTKNRTVTNISTIA